MDIAEAIFQAYVITKTGRRKVRAIHFSMILPAVRKFLTVQEIPALTARAIYPDAQIEGTDSCDTVASQKSQSAASMDTQSQRAKLQQEHKRQLLAAIRLKELSPLNPATFLPEACAEGQVREDAYVSVADFVQFAATLGIGVGAVADDKATKRMDAQLTETERDKYLRLIGALALLLAEKSNRYQRGKNPNASQIAEAVGETLDLLPDTKTRGLGSSNIRECIRAGINLLNK
jgi:predicted trehalose synthase